MMIGMIHAAGGHVLAVNNALPALKQMAVRVAERPASAGIVELLDMVVGGIRNIIWNTSLALI
jgi:hypothetical protein